MALAQDQKAKEIDIKWYRFIYAGFVLLSLYYLFIKKDIGSATTTMGIALIADPFDHKIIWSKRPLWQRVWLIVHLVLLFTAIAYLIVK